MLDKDTRFLIDTNLFISAVKSGWTKSTDLLLRLLDGPWEIVANDILISEYERYAAQFGADRFLALLTLKVLVIEQSEEDIATCSAFFPENEASDIVHAATCLHTGAILISNDKHFKQIGYAGIIEVWTISEAIDKLLRQVSLGEEQIF